jgi:3-hydroxybutyrate dehydrogenase
MTDGTDDLEPEELTADRILSVDSTHFSPDTVAIVTGAGSGIGRVTAAALAHNGLTTVGLDIDEAGLAETADVIERVGGEGRFVAAETDLTNDADCEAAVEAAAEEGTVRYLANVAGLQHISPLPDFEMEKYDQLMDVMTRAPFLLSKLVMPHVRETDDGRGVVANMSSIHGHYATRDKAAYITSKFAIRGLTNAIAAEGEGTLRSFSVSVGYVKTPLVVDQIADQARERGISQREVVEDVMLGQARTKTMMDPIDVGNLFVFGCSDYARHLNGADLLFDGGYTNTYE